MTEETLPKGQTVPSPPKEGEAPKQEQRQMISVEEFLGGYPLDREKCRDVILVEMSRNLGKIAQSLEAINQSLIVVNTHLDNIKKGTTF